jgi:hypothetical protein
LYANKKVFIASSVLLPVCYQINDRSHTSYAEQKLAHISMKTTLRAAGWNKKRCASFKVQAPLVQQIEPCYLGRFCVLQRRADEFSVFVD